MIKYALACSNGHAFDGWFRSGDAFERQVHRDLVSCPQCGATKIEKQPMAPALLKGRGSARLEINAESPTPAAGVPENMRASSPVEVLRAFHRHVLNNSEDVGPRFADEARKIHHGEAEARAIRGQTSRDEAIVLHEEGVEFGLLPLLPEDHN